MTNPLSENKITKALNWTYDKAVNGIGGLDAVLYTIKQIL